MQRLDTRLLADLTAEEASRIEADTGNKLRFETRRASSLDDEGQVITLRVRTPIISNDRYLKLDTAIQTEAGLMTLMAFWDSEHRKLRCQATFRESTSMNGILGRHSDFAIVETVPKRPRNRII